MSWSSKIRTVLLKATPVFLFATLLFVAGCPESTPYDPNPPETTRYEYNYSRVYMLASPYGETSGCTVKTIIYLFEMNIYRPNSDCPEKLYYLQVSLEDRSVMGALNNVVWRGTTDLTRRNQMDDVQDNSYLFYTPDGMDEYWLAAVSAEVELIRFSEEDDPNDEEQRRTLNVDLEWTGDTMFIIREERYFQGQQDPNNPSRIIETDEIGESIQYFAPSTVEGTITGDEFTPIFDVQERVRISRVVYESTYDPD